MSNEIGFDFVKPLSIHEISNEMKWRLEPHSHLCIQSDVAQENKYTLQRQDDMNLMVILKSVPISKYSKKYITKHPSHY